jgi:hypothetical protein
MNGLKCGDLSLTYWVVEHSRMNAITAAMLGAPFEPTTNDC